jgi:uncharacterized membrane protein YphA (DoxX/SURF4 family)
VSTLSRHLPTVARIGLGLIFFVFGLNGFFGFLPQPPMPPAAGAFLGALAATGYMFPLIKATEVISGALLLGNRFVPLALLLLAPVVVNIVAFHSFLASPNPIEIAVLIGELYLAWSYRDAYRSVIQPSARPVGSSVVREQPVLARA